MAELDPVDPIESIEAETVAVIRDGVVADADEVVVVSEVITEPVTTIELPPNRPRKVYAGMWGPAEIGAVAAGALSVLAVVMLYIFWVVPSNNELIKNRSEAERLEAELASARSKYGEITSTETQVAKIVASVDDFEAANLPAAANGRAALYQRINGLIAAYGLINTTGPDYAALEAADSNTAELQSDEDKGRSKYRSLFPGVYVSTTVEGSYHNLRRFIREIETGREFIVVSAVELAPADTERKEQSEPGTAGGTAPPNQTSGPQMGQPNLAAQNQTQPRTRPQGKTVGETVTLRIEMAAYFRRPNFAPAITQ